MVLLQRKSNLSNLISKSKPVPSPQSLKDLCLSLPSPKVQCRGFQQLSLWSKDLPQGLAWSLSTSVAIPDPSIMAQSPKKNSSSPLELKIWNFRDQAQQDPQLLAVTQFLIARNDQWVETPRDYTRHRFRRITKIMTCLTSAPTPKSIRVRGLEMCKLSGKAEDRKTIQVLART